MTLKRSTRSAFLLSVLSLILCFSMLLGTTFAWFTDTAKTGVNKIQAGTLKIDLLHKNAESALADKDGWVSVKDNKDYAIWDYDLWEPGYTQYETVKVVNEGTLALKFRLTANADESTVVLGKNGENLADVIDVYIANGEVTKPATFAELKADTETWTNAGVLSSIMLDADGIAYGILLPAGEDVATAKTLTDKEKLYAKSGETTMTIALHMKEEAGNEYQALSLGDLYVTLVATQQTYESDSFDHMYDEFAEYDGEISSAESLALALATGGTYKLTKDITLDSAVAVAEGVEVVLDLGGKTISAPASYAIENKGDLTVNGEGTITGLGAINSTAGKLVINGGTYYGTSKGSANQWQHTLRATNSEVVINGGTFDITLAYDEAEGKPITTNAMINVSDNGSVTINGGTFKSAKVLSTFDAYMFTYKPNGNLTINGGDFFGGWRFNETATTNIYGGTFNLTTDGQSFQPNNPHVLTVYGGTFSFGKADTQTSVLGCVADGYSAVENADGTFVVLPGVYNESVSEGLYADGEGNYAVTSAAGMSALNGIISKNVKSVELLADIDMTGTPWNMVDMHADANGMLATFNGNDKTISNLVINGEAMFSRIAPSTDTVTFSNVTFENVTIDSAKSNAAIISKQLYKNVVLDNVDVKGAEITGETKVATLVGSVFNEGASAITLTVKNCDISDVVITGNPNDASEERIAGLVAWVADKYSNEAIVLENNTMTNVAINSNSTASEHHALIYISDENASNRYGVYHNEDAGVTLTDCTYTRKVADGLFADENGSFYVYSADGLIAMHDTIDPTWGTDYLSGKSINIMADIDATGKTWNTINMQTGSSKKNGFTFNGNGYTISNLQIVGSESMGTGLFAVNCGTANPSVFKDITFDNVTVSGGWHTGIIWGQAYGNMVVENVNVVNSNVTGVCNVGALIGRNGDDLASNITFKNCSVKNTNVTSTGGGDNCGASAFIGMALKTGGASVNLVFEGTNVTEGNTLTSATGHQGGGIYAKATWGEASWDAPVVVNDFTNYDCTK